jgi:GNAT superfamily N-acetyltransferase
VTAVAIGPVDAAGLRAAVPELAALLVDAVAGGAGVNFTTPLEPNVAATWWEARVPLVEAGVITPVLARERDDPAAPDRLVGVVLLIRAMQQNGPHRADISKLLVHSGARRRGIARDLMSAAEAIAKADGRWLLVLDTETGSAADSVYRALGWTAVGTIPDYALLTSGVPGPATIFYKDLR